MGAMIEIGSIILDARKSRGMGQNTLAKRAGMTPAQLCQFEKGRVSPTLRTLERIAAALDMTVVEFLSGSGRKDSITSLVISYLE